MQMSFDLPGLSDLDMTKTRENVEAEFEKYRMYKYLGFEERESVITASYQQRVHGPTNVTSDPTANVAIYNVDEPEYRRKFCERIERAVNDLPLIERKIISARYLQDDYTYDIHIYNNLKSDVLDFTICQKTYDKIRKQAMRRLALRLNVAVLKQGKA